MPRFLLLCHDDPKGNWGAALRARAIRDGLALLGEVDVLVVYRPGMVEPAGPGVFRVGSAAGSPMGMRLWHYSLGELRRNDGLARHVSRMHEACGGYTGIVATFWLAAMADCAGLARTWADVDTLPSSEKRSRLPGFDRLREAAFRRSHRRVYGLIALNEADAARLEHDRVVVQSATTSQRDALPLRPPSPGPKRNLLFIGGASWAPNRDGIHRFVNLALPQLLREFPDLELRVVGEGHHELEGREGVRVLGYVPSVADWLADAWIAIAPIWDARGAIQKLSEYAAYGQAIVAASASAANYFPVLRPGVHLMTASSEGEMADRCRELLLDEGKRAKMAASALEVARARLSQEAMNATMAACFAARGAEIAYAPNAFSGMRR